MYANKQMTTPVSDKLFSNPIKLNSVQLPGEILPSTSSSFQVGTFLTPSTIKYLGEIHT